MQEVIFPGAAGRLEGRYQSAKATGAPVALILHPHPQFGGSMNNRVVQQLALAFQRQGFSILRFNFRGVGRSQGSFDAGLGELADAASALDWVQGINPNMPGCWVAGFSFGAWIGMQLLMRRPEITGFVSVAPPANMYDFTFLAPCPSSGLIVHGKVDRVVPEADIQRLLDRLATQKGIKVDLARIDGANHFFDNRLEELGAAVEGYLQKRQLEPAKA